MARAARNPVTKSRAERARLSSLLAFERILWSAGITDVAGVDEAGIGPLAGPVVAAAVILPVDIDIVGVKDSKLLSEAQRTQLESAIRARARACSVAVVSVDEIDQRNIYHAGLEAMRRAVDGLSLRPAHVLVDARTIPGISSPQNAFEKGDAINYSIGCASILAKVARDRLMVELEQAHPGYGFASHKGYGTAEHFAAIRRLGPSPAHRRSFPVLSELAGEGSAGFYRLRAALASATADAELTAIAREISLAPLGATEVRKLRALLARSIRRISR